jgi:hypothetical protein
MSSRELARPLLDPPRRRLVAGGVGKVAGVRHRRRHLRRELEAVLVVALRTRRRHHLDRLEAAVVRLAAVALEAIAAQRQRALDPPRRHAASGLRVPRQHHRQPAHAAGAGVFCDPSQPAPELGEAELPRLPQAVERHDRARGGAAVGLAHLLLAPLPALPGGDPQRRAPHLLRQGADLGSRTLEAADRQQLGVGAAAGGNPQRWDLGHQFLPRALDGARV